MVILGRVGSWGRESYPTLVISTRLSLEQLVVSTEASLGLE